MSSPPATVQKAILVLRVASVTLIAGWVASAVVGAAFALLQYQEVVRSFPPDQVTAAFQARLDREVWRGSLLLLAHVGVICGGLWWQTQVVRQRYGRNNGHNNGHNKQVTATATVAARVGLLAGTVVAFLEGLAGVSLGTPPLFLLPLCVVILATGWGADQPGDR